MKDLFLSALRKLCCLGLGLLTACQANWNDPYPAADQSASVLYSAFIMKPKHLDPVQSYSEDESIIHGQIYEPPLQYHYLKRPYTLEPSTLSAMPEVLYLDANLKPLPSTATPGSVAFSEYTLRIQPGILYQPHPAFAKDEAGKAVYLNLSAAQISSKKTITDFERTGTRELLASDYVHQIKRLASPNLHSPIFELMSQYIVGLKALHSQLKAGHKTKGEWVDVSPYSLEGVSTPDAHTLKIRIKGVYPQFQYWLAMSFFAPVPPEVDQFFGQAGMFENGLSLDTWPVGTGPYMLKEYDPNARIVLTKNPNYRLKTYPCEGEPEDRIAGLLKDCGKPLPLIENIVFTREPESVPYWNKFLQGYYDVSGLSSDNFDQAINTGGQGEVTLSDDMRAKGMSLAMGISPSVFYMGVNMLDARLGGSSESARKLRQALALAIDQDEFVSIFLNGRGIPAMSPIPPGVSGHPEGKEGINPYLYDWKEGKAQRKSLELAKKMLAEAGWPDGRHAQTGEPLVVYLDTTSTGMGDKAIVDWLSRQLRQVGVQLVVRATDWNRFQEKLRAGTAQLFFMGWNADYPDPENFLFLLYGPQGRANGAGDNAANYKNPAYDALFERMKQMTDSGERQVIIQKMVALLQHDAPWLWGYYPKSFALQHAWLQNRKPTGGLIRNSLQYQGLDAAARATQRKAWNQPKLWPLALLLTGFWILIFPVWRMWQKRQAETALPVEVQKD